MATLTKAEVRTAVRQAIDDPSAKNWTDPNLDVLIQLTEDTMFEAILDTFPFFTSSLEAETTDANGVILLSALTVPGRFYAVQRIRRNSDSVVIQPILFGEAVPQAETYFILGDEIIAPNEATIALDIEYSFLPAEFTSVADGTAIPNYPEGHEAALIYLSSAWAMTKGDKESMGQIGRIADSAVEALLTHIARRYPVNIANRVQMVKSQIMRNMLIPPQAAS